MKKTRTTTNDNSISDQMRSANKCSRRPRSATRYLVQTARRHSSNQSITKNYLFSEIHITNITTGQMVHTSLNDDMWSAFVSNYTKPSRSEKIGVRDKFYDTMAFTFSEDSHVSHDIRTGHLPNTRCDPKVLRRVVLRVPCVISRGRHHNYVVLCFM
jgi:hypothetical protein